MGRLAARSATDPKLARTLLKPFGIQTDDHRVPVPGMPDKVAMAKAYRRSQVEEAAKRYAGSVEALGASARSAADETPP